LIGNGLIGNNELHNADRFLTSWTIIIITSATRDEAVNSTIGNVFSSSNFCPFDFHGRRNGRRARQ
jgi:hypothetical protein